MWGGILYCVHMMPRSFEVLLDMLNNGDDLSKGVYPDNYSIQTMWRLSRLGIDKDR
jgi:hypothetical protein